MATSSRPLLLITSPPPPLRGPLQSLHRPLITIRTLQRPREPHDLTKTKPSEMNTPTLLRRLAYQTPRSLAASSLILRAATPSSTWGTQRQQKLQTGPRQQEISMSTTPSFQAQQARFSQGSDETSLSPTLETLLRGGRWALVNDGEAVERSFRFKNFAKTWDFMTAVSLQCKTHNHHPEWSNVYNTTFIRWTTHSPKGLSDKDLKLAMVCDALAKDFGEVEVEVEAPAARGEAAVSCGIRGLADKAAGTAGDCCTPKK